ncbi:hypothetical protein ART_1837 [Arthrobacter sp. PAMC 25486]|nr:hypothetical protein ART_1837 [Arthrobacter sp. PAMC 25486]
MTRTRIRVTCMASSPQTAGAGAIPATTEQPRLTASGLAT